MNWSAQIVIVKEPFQKNADLNRFKLVEDGLVAADGAAHDRFGELEGGALVRDLIAYLVRLPRVLKCREIELVGALQLLADARAGVPLSRE